MKIEILCNNCRKSASCSLWNQLLNEDDSFHNYHLEYDRNKQSVELVVTICEYYAPKHVKKRNPIKA